MQDVKITLITIGYNMEEHSCQHLSEHNVASQVVEIIKTKLSFSLKGISDCK